MPGTRIEFKIVPQRFNSTLIYQHELDLRTFKVSIIQHYDTWVNNLFLKKKKNSLSPISEVCAITHDIIIKYMHKNF